MGVSEVTLESAAEDLVALRRALADLDAVLGAKDKRADVERLQQAKELLERLGSFLDKLQVSFDLERKERHQLGALCAISQAVNSSRDLAAVLNLVIDTIIEVMHAERGFLLLFDTVAKDLSAAVARNMDGSSIRGEESISRTIVARVAREGLPILTTNAQSDPRFAGRESVVNYQLRSIICVPLRVKDKITGVIYVDNRFRDGVFSPDDRDLMASFANQAALGIESARLFGELQQKMSEIATIKNYRDNVFASITSGVIAIDTNGLITTFNRAAESILGIKAQQALRRPYVQMLGGLQSFALPELLQQAQSEQRRFVGREAEAQLPDGRVAWLRLSLSPLLDGQGKGLGVALVIDDLSERKRLEQERAAQERETERIRNVFERYVAPSVVERILSDPSQIALGGRQCQVSILFADIRGFSAFSETTSPDRLVDLLNQHLALAVQAILQEEGTLDKYMGDSVLAVFNAPLPQADHPLRAVRAALALQKAMNEHRESQGDGGNGFSFGIGINVGNAVVGNIGAPQMMNYTVIGDAVNLAKRLQESAAPGQILLSAALYEQVKEMVSVNPLPPLRVKGHAEPEEVYELWGLREMAVAAS
jgi:PAS domain S-box-containing protein